MTRTGLFLYDLLKGTHLRESLRFLNGSQHWSREKLEVYQLKKLNILLEKVMRDVPFYREYQSTGIPEYRNSNSSGIQVFRHSGIPIIGRQQVIEAGESLLSEKINKKKCKVSRTGGTTGPPLRIYRDTETRSFSLAAYYRFYGWMGVEPGMPEAELWGSTGVNALKIEDRKSKIENRATLQRSNIRYQLSDLLVSGTWDRLSNFRSYNAFSFNDEYLKEVVVGLKRFQPKLIRGYLSAILLLADYIKRHNIKGIHPIAVSCTSETLFPEYRKIIEEVFQAPLFNQYGCGECNSIAFECKEHNGMHITMEHCILESNKDNSLIVTNLDNYSQPFIRYMNGDIGIIDQSPCSCGYAGPRLLQLQGRANENIILKDGVSVNGIFFANLLDEAGLINSNRMLRFQVVQNIAGEIEFKTEVKKELNTSDFNKLNDALMPFFNNVEISQHQFLDSGPNGKFRYIISNI